MSLHRKEEDYDELFPLREEEEHANCEPYSESLHFDARPEHEPAGDSTCEHQDGENCGKLWSTKSKRSTRRSEFHCSAQNEASFNCEMRKLSRRASAEVEQVLRGLNLADALASEEIIAAEVVQRDRRLSNVNFSNSTRYVVLCISLVCLSLVVSNSTALNFTILCMQEEEEVGSMGQQARQLPAWDNASEVNDSLTSLLQERPLFTVAQRSALFSATAIGTLLGTIPVTYITSRFGIRLMFTSYGMVSAFSTLATPLAAAFGFAALFAVRVVSGLAVATTFVAMGAISAEWSPLKNSGVYLALLTCHLQFGIIFTMPVAGFLCDSRWGWPALYYLQGGLSAMAFILFFEFFRDSPRFQKHVSDKELAKIEEGKTTAGLSQKESRKLQIHVPYRAMLADWVVRGILIAGVGGSLGFSIFNQFGPIYLNKALGMDIRKTGYAAAFPYVISTLVKWVAGGFSDRLTCITEKGRVIFFASTSQFMMAACYAVINFIPPSQPFLIQICFTLVVAFSGLNCVGTVKAAQMTARHFSHVIMAWNTLLGAIIVLLLPVAVGLAAPDNTQEQWGQIFVTIAILVTLCTAVFNFTVEIEPRDWTKMNVTHQQYTSSNDKFVTNKADCYKQPLSHDIVQSNMSTHNGINPSGQTSPQNPSARLEAGEKLGMYTPNGTENKKTVFTLS